MKKIILVRHAKSSWKYDLPDRERGLKTRGVIDAQNVANEFLKTHGLPDSMFCSPAKRARDTCKIFLNAAQDSNLQIEIIEELYDFGGSSVIKFLKSLPNHIQDILVFGHNYALTHIAKAYGDVNIDNLPTSGLVVLGFEIEDWSALKKGRTLKVLIPKDLRNG